MAARQRPESDIVISSRIRLARNLAEFPFISRASRQTATEIERTLRERDAADCQRIRADLEYFNVNELEGHRSAVPGRAAADQPRACRKPRRPRRGHRPPRAGQPDDQRGRPSAHPGACTAGSTCRPPGSRSTHRRPDRRPRDLCLPPTARLSDRLPDERRHRRARQRDAAPAGAGDHPADRKGVSQLAKNQPGRARPVWRRLAGDGRLLPDQQPDHARPDASRNW